MMLKLIKKFYHLLFLLFHLAQLLTASQNAKTDLQYLVGKAGTNLLFNITQNPPVLISGDEKRVIVHPRENVELACPISCDPVCHFHWTKGNESIEQWDRFHFPKQSKAQLQIRALKHEDAGIYECLGVNGFGSTVAKIRLIVEGDDPSESNLIKRTPIEGYPPTILAKQFALPVQNLVSVSRGENIFWHCEANGYPTPNITWYKNNLYLLGSNDNVSQLKLINATEEDGGSYECEAENELGKSKYKIRLEVKETGGGGGGGSGNVEAAKILSLTPTNLTLFPGRNGSFTCVVRSNASTKPVLFWVKRLQSRADSERAYNHKGEWIEMLDLTEVIQESANTYSTSLVFNNVTRRRAGTYVCAVEGPMEDFEHLEASLIVEIDIAKIESGRRKAAQVQWTLLLTFCFVVASLLTIACFSKLYGCRKRAKTPLPVTGSLLKQNGGGGFQRVPVPSKSPGETVSTTLTQPNEVYERFIKEDYYEDVSDLFSSPCQGWNNGSFSVSRDASSSHHCPISSRKKRFYRQKRIEDFSISESSSMSDSLYEKPPKYQRVVHRESTPRPTTAHHNMFPGNPRRVNEFRLLRIPYGNHRNYMEPPCTPATALSVKSDAT